MKVFIDENIPFSCVDFLVSQGYEIIDIRKTIQEGLHDKDIFLLAQQHKAIFLTTDKDFFHTIPKLFTKHYGIIVISLRKPNKKSILEKLKWAVIHLDLNDIQNKVYFLRDNIFSKKE